MSESEYVKGRRSVHRQVTLRAPAKVNLHLEILRQREPKMPLSQNTHW